LAAPLLDAPVVGFEACQLVDDPAVLVFWRDLHNSKYSALAVRFPENVCVASIDHANTNYRADFVFETLHIASDLIFLSDIITHLHD
jgi:hypothetical protein